MNSSAASVMGLIQALPGPCLGAIVLPAEGDALVVEGDEPAVRDGDAVGVAGEVGEHRLGSGERALGVDHPFAAAQRREAALKARARRAGARSPKKARRAGLHEAGEAFEEEPAEEAREHAHGQEEAGPAGDPALSVRREAAARDDAVDVRVVGHRRAPGVEHGGQADARAQMLGSAAIVVSVSAAALNRRS